MRLRLLAMHLSVVLQTRLGHIVVDGLHAGVVAHKGGHLGGGPVDTIDATRLDASIQKKPAHMCIAR